MDDLADALGVEILLLALAQVQHDAGAARRRARILGDGEGAAAVGGPQPALVLAGAPGRDLDLLGHHEGGVEADAELADEVGALGLVLQLLHEGGGARACDGAEVVDQLLAVHADAVVGDGERLGGRVGLQADLEAAVVTQQAALGERRVAQPVAGVGGVGDQLPEEDLLFRIERVGDDIEEPADLSLEIHLFFRHGLPSVFLAAQVWGRPPSPATPRHRSRGATAA